jgi:hypothetical protein
MSKNIKKNLTNKDYTDDIHEVELISKNNIIKYLDIKNDIFEGNPVPFFYRYIDKTNKLVLELNKIFNKPYDLTWSLLSGKNYIHPLIMIWYSPFKKSFVKFIGKINSDGNVRNSPGNRKATQINKFYKPWGPVLFIPLQSTINKEFFIKHYFYNTVITKLPEIPIQQKNEHTGPKTFSERYISAQKFLNKYLKVHIITYEDLFLFGNQMFDHYVVNRNPFYMASTSPSINDSSPNFLMSHFVGAKDDKSEITNSVDYERAIGFSPGIIHKDYETNRNKIIKYYKDRNIPYDPIPTLTEILEKGNAERERIRKLKNKLKNKKRRQRMRKRKKRNKK